MKSSLLSRTLAAAALFSLGAFGAANARAANATPDDSATQKVAPVLNPNTPPGTMTYNVRAFGATGDGKTIDSDAVNRAIDAATANGGGTVFFPAGYYLCYSIHLKSNITLYLDQGSWIIAANSPAQGGRSGGGGGRGGAGAGAAGAQGTGGGAAGAGAGAGAAAAAGARGGAGGFGGAADTAPAAWAATFGVPAAARVQPLDPNDANPPPATLGYDAPEENMWTGFPDFRSPAQPITPGAIHTGPSTLPIDQVYQDFGHSHWHNSLIWGDGIYNVSIIGPGIIYGRGLSRGDSANTRPGTGNKSIALKNCRNVLLRDFTVLQGGWFCLLATGVDNLTVSNIKVDTNRDGFDIDCCQNVRVSDCTVNSPQDDGICLKSSYGLGYARSTENVTITNCQVSGYLVGTLLDGTYQISTGRGDGGGAGTGRIKFGTESNGGYKNITISNCVFIHCRGLAIESVDGAIIEDVTVSNIAMRDIVNAPIYIRLGRRLRGPADITTVGVIRRVNINNLTVSGATNIAGIIIAGTIDHPVQDVHLSDIHILYDGNGGPELANTMPPEDESGFYPEPGRLGTMPSYGLFARHVTGLTLRNVEVGYGYQDFRPPVVLDDVKSVEFDHFTGQHAPNVASFVLKNVTDFSTESSAGVPNTHLDNVADGSVPAAAAKP